MADGKAMDKAAFVEWLYGRGADSNRAVSDHYHQGKRDALYALASEIESGTIALAWQDGGDALRKALQDARDSLGCYADCCDGCTCGDGWSHKHAIEGIQEIDAALVNAPAAAGSACSAVEREYIEACVALWQGQGGDFAARADRVGKATHAVLAEREARTAPEGER